MDGGKLEDANGAEHGVKNVTPNIFTRLTSTGNVEERGVVPVPLEERTNRRTYLIVRSRKPARHRIHANRS